MAVDVLELVRAESAAADGGAGDGLSEPDGGGGGGGGNVSSSNIRDALAAGDLSAVEDALGRPYQLTLLAAAGSTAEYGDDAVR